MSPDSPSKSVDQLRAWAEIDLGALAENARACSRIAGKNGKLLAVIKADGYGHGIRQIASALSPLPEVFGFGVANVTEAQTIADAIGDGQPVLILGPVLPVEREAVVAGGFSAALSNPDEAAAFAKVSKTLGRKASIHVTIDTGMGRMGAMPDEVAELVTAVRASEWLQLDGITTHFPSADEDARFTDEQIEDFCRLTDDYDQPILIHAANSAGVLAFSDKLGFTNLMRPGLALYGVAPVSKNRDLLSPVLSLKSRVTLVRDLPAGHSVSYGRTFITGRPTTVATIGIGYGDGYPRSLSGNGADVLIAGQRCPLLGRVTMDQIMVDVTDLEARPLPGDEVVLIGGEIDATEIAEKAGTIAWEILTGITQRVVRVYC